MSVIPLKNKSIKINNIFLKFCSTMCYLQDIHFRFRVTNRLEVKQWEEIHHVNSNHEKAGATTLTSGKINFETKKYILLALMWEIISG